MEKLKKDEFVRLRINKVEKSRLDKLVGLTCRKRSDLFRDAMFHYIKEHYPGCLQ
jgi:metal-responsive CopG/Arc/MetJ family transcriptional regulator